MCFMVKEQEVLTRWTKWLLY